MVKLLSFNLLLNKALVISYLSSYKSCLGRGNNKVIKGAVRHYQSHLSFDFMGQ